MKEIIDQILPIPYRCSWELTLECNMKCRHCGSTAGTSRKNELSIIEAQQVCDALSDMKCEEVTFLGGEPLLRKDLISIGQRLQHHNISTKLISNGKLIDQSVADSLANIGILCVGLSLDGTEYYHNRLRCDKNSFASVASAVKVLKSSKIPVSIVTVVSNENIDELESVADILRQWKIDQWQIQLIIPKGRASSEFEIDSSLNKLLIDKLIELKTICPFEIHIGCNVGYFYREDEIRSIKQGKLGFWTGCYAGILHMALRSNGDVTGCLTMPEEWTAGNIRLAPLQEIWSNNNNFINRQKLNSDVRQNCQYKNICRGGCRTLGYYLSKNENSCEVCALMDSTTKHQEI